MNKLRFIVIALALFAFAGCSAVDEVEEVIDDVAEDVAEVETYEFKYCLTRDMDNPWLELDNGDLVYHSTGERGKGGSSVCYYDYENDVHEKIDNFIGDVEYSFSGTAYLNVLEKVDKATGVIYLLDGGRGDTRQVYRIKVDVNAKTIEEVGSAFTSWECIVDCEDFNPMEDLDKFIRDGGVFTFEQWDELVKEQYESHIEKSMNN